VPAGLTAPKQKETFCTPQAQGWSGMVTMAAPDVTPGEWLAVRSVLVSRHYQILGLLGNMFAERDDPAKSREARRRFDDLFVKIEGEIAAKAGRRIAVQPLLRLNPDRRVHCRVLEVS
jgi:hypothetical protein